MFPKWLSVPCIGVAMDNEEGPCNDFVFSRTSLVSELNRSISENNQDAWNGNAPHAYVLDKSAHNPIILHRIPMCSSPVPDPLYAELSPQPMECPYRYAGCQWNSLVISVAKHLQQNVSEHLQLVHAHTKKQDECIAGLKRKIGDASASKNGTLIWKISNVSQKVNWKDLELVSQPFYTSLTGYKLQASLFLTGNGAGERTHLSLYIKILPGQYDSVLSWPFIHSISFTLLDQNTSGQVVNVTKTFIPDTNWPNSNRPSEINDEDRLGFGFPKFVHHDILTKRAYVKGDILFIKIRSELNHVLIV